MKYRQYSFISIFFVFFIYCILSPTAIGQNEKEDDLIGHWTFENGVERKDLTGHFGDIELRGAEVKDG